MTPQRGERRGEVGLALAARARGGRNHSERELELCRLAGGAGDDLLLAGRCTPAQRDSASSHRDGRAPSDHALAGAWRGGGTTPRGKSGRNDGRARRASEALLRALARAVETLWLLEDEEPRGAWPAARRRVRAAARLEAAGADED